MREILIATHEKYAEGIRAAAELILGPQPEVSVICAYTGEIELSRQLENYFSACTSEDEVLVLTDLYGGSVNQACMQYTTRPGTHLVTGINLALLIQILTMDKEHIDIEGLRAAVEEAKNQIIYVNEVMKEMVTDDFGF